MVSAVDTCSLLDKNADQEIAGELFRAELAGPTYELGPCMRTSDIVYIQLYII